MAKKTGGRAQNKAQRRAVHRIDPAVDSAVVAPPSAPTQTVTPPVAPPAPPARYATRSAGVSPRRAQQSAPVPVDYSYVRSDLKRVGILVGIIVVVLIGLTFVLR